MVEPVVSERTFYHLSEIMGVCWVIIISTFSGLGFFTLLDSTFPFSELVTVAITSLFVGLTIGALSVYQQDSTKFRLEQNFEDEEAEKE